MKAVVSKRSAEKSTPLVGAVGLLLHKTHSDPHKTSQTKQICIFRLKFRAGPSGISVAVVIHAR